MQRTMLFTGSLTLAVALVALQVLVSHHLI